MELSPSPRAQTDLASPNHALRSGCSGFVQQFQRLFRSLGDQQLAPAALRQEAAFRRMVDELDHAVPKALDVKQAERLLVIAERVPAPRLEQLVERTDAAGKREESVGQVRHLRLALMHVGDGVELGQAEMRDLDVDQRLWDHAEDLAAAR